MAERSREHPIPWGPQGTSRCSQFLPYRPTWNCTKRFLGDAPWGGLFPHLGNPGELNHCSAHPGHQQAGDTMGTSTGCSGTWAASPTVPGWEHTRLGYGATHSQCYSFPRSPVRKGSAVALGFFLQT